MLKSTRLNSKAIDPNNLKKQDVNLALKISVAKLFQALSIWHRNSLKTTHQEDTKALSPCLGFVRKSETCGTFEETN